MEIAIAKPGFGLSWKILAFLIGGVALYCVLNDASFAADIGNMPGKDETAKLEAAGTLLRLVDTGLFKWGARLFAGLCIMSGAWALKEQRFGIAVICVIGAVIFGTATTWVRNVFSIGGDAGLFGEVVPIKEKSIAQMTEEVTRGSLRQS